MIASPVIRNPVLRGSHPDPCIVRVADDFYVATSTFEWHPGVALHHSRDLVHWRPLGHVLTRPEQLDLRGVPDSGGIWAPDLSFDGTRFYVVFSVVRERAPGVVLANAVVTASDPAGPWSDPVYLNGSGWDPSLFHDIDGRKWLVNVLIEHRVGRAAMSGIVLQEWDARAGGLIGPRHHLGHGRAEGGFAEAPHLYRRGGYVYLMLAEGGTWEGHAVTLYRARDVRGPYAPCPANPLMTSADAPDWPLQRAGHASLVDAPDGSWWVAFLCARPSPGHPGALLGRETALARVRWTDDGWLALDAPDRRPPVELRAPDVPAHRFEPARVERDVWADPEWQSLRTPADPTWVSSTVRPGSLLVRGRDPVTSRIEPSVVARRLPSTRCRVEVAVDFAAASPLEAAGLVIVSDAQDNVGLYVTATDDGGRVLVIVQVQAGSRREPLAVPIALPADGVVWLRATIDDARLTFAYAEAPHAWRGIDVELDARFLADRHGGKEKFSGAFVGVAVEDRDRASRWAAFDAFGCEPL